MSVPAIKGIESAQVPGDLDAFVPDDPDDVDILLDLQVGPTTGPGAELVQVRVLTLLALARRLGADTWQDIGRKLARIGFWEFDGSRR